MDDRDEERAEDERYESFCAILGAVLCYCLSPLSMGYFVVYFNSIEYPVIEKLYSIEMDSGEGEGLLSGCVTFGAVFGSILATVISRYLSRKYSHFYLGTVSFLAMPSPLHPRSPFSTRCSGPCCSAGWCRASAWASSLPLCPS
jgi:hypothetical protein